MEELEQEEKGERREAAPMHRRRRRAEGTASSRPFFRFLFDPAMRSEIPLLLRECDERERSNNKKREGVLCFEKKMTIRIFGAKWIGKKCSSVKKWKKKQAERLCSFVFSSSCVEREEESLFDLLKREKTEKKARTLGKILAKEKIEINFFVLRRR